MLVDMLTLVLVFLVLCSQSCSVRVKKDDFWDLVAEDDIKGFVEKLKTEEPGFGTEWFYATNGDGEPVKVMLEPETPHIGTRILPTKFDGATKESVVNKITIKLYTRIIPSGKVLNTTNLDLRGFKPRRPTKVIIHGWMAGWNSTVVTAIRDAYLTNLDVNVIVVDWSEIANTIKYWSPAGSTKAIGEFLADVIDSIMFKSHSNHKDVHLIGHSLGAHIAGFVGSNTKEKLGRITGLDPALPGFKSADAAYTIDKTDAKFVDVIHTSSGVLGIVAPAGHVDFYPNGGSLYQKGCYSRWYDVPLKLMSTLQACAHSRAHEYFAESIGNPNFRAVKCSSWRSFKKNKCEKNFTVMGEHVSKKDRGIFYLITNAVSPFSLGKRGLMFS